MKKRIISILLILTMVFGMVFSTTGTVFAAGPSSGYYGEYGYTATLDEISGKAGYVRFWGWAFNEYRVGCTMPTYVYKWNGSSYQYVTTVNLNRNARGDVQNAYSLGTNYVGFGHNLPLASGYYAFRIHVTGGSYSPMAAWSEGTYKDYYVSMPTAYFDKQGGTGGTDNTPVDYGTTYHNTITNPSRVGYDFNGYYTAANGGGSQYFDAAGNMTSQWWYTGNGTLYAYWTPSKYTVTLSNGGVDITTAGTASTTATYTKSMPEIDVPVRTGYTFDGYWTASTGGTQYYSADGTSVKDWDIASDTTLYAHWNLDSYTVKYYDGSAAITKKSENAVIGDATYVSTFSYEDPVTLPTDVTKANAIFNGWYEDDDFSGSPVFAWAAHDASRLSNQTFYASWIDIEGTRADSEKQVFSASLFDEESPAYSTAEVVVTLDGQVTDVNQVQLKQEGKSTLTMAGTSGNYTFSSSADVSGAWEIWVNGENSGQTMTFGSVATVSLVTVNVGVTNDGSPASDRSVVLKKAGNKELNLSESDVAGTYQLQTFADENKTYNIYIDGQDTGKTVTLKDAATCSNEVAFWTISVNTTKDGSAAHMGAAELRDGTKSLSLTGLNGTYTLNHQEDMNTDYDLFVAGLDTGFDLSFTENGRSQMVNYHTVTVRTKADGEAATLDDVTLRQNGAVVHTLAPSSMGVFSVVAQQHDTAYEVYVGEDNSGKTASFTAAGKSPETIDYNTVCITTTLDGSKAAVGSVILKSDDTQLALPSITTGVYAKTMLADSTAYSLYIGGESAERIVKFSSAAAEKKHQIDFKSLKLTLKLDDEACSLGSVVLKKSGAPDVAMQYKDGLYTATSWRTGNYDIFLDGADTGKNMKAGTPVTVDYYTVSYNLDGGSGDLPAAKVYQKGTELTLPVTIPVKDDYQFVAWSCDGASEDFEPSTAGGYDDKLVVGSESHNLTALWKANSSFQARFQAAGSDQWTYANLQYAVDYAKEHSGSFYMIEVNNNCSLSEGTEVMSNVSMTVPAGVSVGGNFVNHGSMDLKGDLIGTVTNDGTITGGFLREEDSDSFAGNGTISKLVNLAAGTVSDCTITKVKENAGVLKDAVLAGGTSIGGSVEGTIYAEGGVTFANDLSTRYMDGSAWKQAVISLVGGGTISGASNMNAAAAFAGLMQANGDHQLANGVIHLRSKVTVNNNQVYADFFDFTEPADLVYDKTAKDPSFASTRTPGMGDITKVMYKQVGGKPSWSDWAQWTEEVPVNVGTYQVRIDVADGEYFVGRSSVTDAACWTFTITPKEAGLTWTAPEDLVYTKTAKVPAVEVNNLETGDVCTVTAVVSEDNENIHVGGFTFTAVDLANKNYKLPENVTSPAYTITPKPLTAQWVVISKDYDGSPLTPEALLPGIEAGDVVTTTFDGDNTKPEAGSYVLTAGLSNENYMLTNEQTNFTIQKAGVQFSVSEDMVVADGNAHAAVVTADPQVDFTVSYRNEKGEEVSAPVDPGEYGIYATIGDDNYRMAGRGEGRQVLVGTLIISRSSLPSAYKVSFDKGEGGTGSMEDMAAVKAGDARTLPACEFTRSGYVFAGWKYGKAVYQAGEAFVQPSRDVQLVAQWTEKVYEIAGAVRSADGQVLQGAVVRLMSGSRQIGTSQISDAEGGFLFEGVLPGTYNLVVSENGVVVTTAVVISDASETALAVKLPAGRANSVVEVAAGTADVVVSGLDDSFSAVGDNFTADDQAVLESGGSVEFKLEIAENTAPEMAQQTAVEDLARNVGMYLDMNLFKTVVDEDGVRQADQSGKLYTSDTMLAVVIPLPGDLQAMSRYTVYRFHKAGDDAEEVLETLEQVSEDGVHDQEGYSISRDKTYITVYTKSFSLYALGYVPEGQKYKILNPETEHGTVKVYPASAQKGKTVTVTVDPEEGYLLETLHVYDIRGNELALTAGEDGFTYTFVMPARKVEIKASFLDVESMMGFFEDVYSTDYYYEAVRWAAAAGITGGTDATHFSPLNITTRAQMITFLWKASGSPVAEGAMPFADVAAEAYYAPAVLWAAQEGITSGTSLTTFSPEMNVTRAQAITLLNHYVDTQFNVGDAGSELTSGTSAGSVLTGGTSTGTVLAEIVASTPVTCPFTDVSVDAYYHKAVAWASEQKITSGTSDDKFSPDADCTRAQIITFLWKTFQLKK